MKGGAFPEPERVFHAEAPLRLERDGDFRLEEQSLVQPDWVFKVAEEFSFASARMVNWLWPKIAIRNSTLT